VLAVSAEQLLSMAMSIVAAEEVAREVARGVKVEVSVTQQRPRETKVVRLVDAEPGTIISEAGPGRLVELVVVSNTRGYELTIVADGRIIASGTFDWYQSISPYSEWIDAFENNGTFILRVSDVSFSTSLSVRFRPVVSTLATPVKLKWVVAKIDKW
jgi:hypothetical protein